VTFNLPVAIGPDRTDLVQFRLESFTTDSTGLTADTMIQGKTFRILFDDGSEITVTP